MRVFDEETFQNQAAYLRDNPVAAHLIKLRKNIPIHPRVVRPS